mmetsp:Transcript_71282/g.158451  ORF Transcript_71282/g.158451 Transcript_71282/m.158451 type:complete len:231 (+) Transcript_71282:383-1075(+)
MRLAIPIAARIESCGPPRAGASHSTERGEIVRHIPRGAGMVGGNEDQLLARPIQSCHSILLAPVNHAEAPPDVARVLREHKPLVVGRSYRVLVGIHGEESPAARGIQQLPVDPGGGVEPPEVEVQVGSKAPSRAVPLSILRIPQLLAQRGRVKQVPPPTALLIAVRVHLAHGPPRSRVECIPGGQRLIVCILITGGDEDIRKIAPIKLISKRRDDGGLGLALKMASLLSA